MDGKCFSDYQKVAWTEGSVCLKTGITMAYTVCGPENGMPVVLIHGVTDGRVSWSQVAPIMAERGYHCYVPEYRGNGKTDKPNPGPQGYLVETHTKDILAFLDAMQLNKVHIVGHSLGSLIAQRINILAPERVLSTTLIESAVSCHNNEVLTWAEKGNGTDYLGVHGYDKEQKLPDSFLKDWADNTNEDESFQMATLEHIRQMPYSAFGWLITGLNAFDNKEDIGKITGKVLVIWATEDAIFTAKDQEELKAGLINCDVTYQTVEGASHNVHWDSIRTRTEVVRYIDEFIHSI